MENQELNRDLRREQQSEQCRLGPIYAADALSFLNHFWLERSRQVSRHCNGTVVRGRRFRGELRPRDYFEAFSLRLVRFQIHQIFCLFE